MHVLAAGVSTQREWLVAAPGASWGRAPCPHTCCIKSSTSSSSFCSPQMSVFSHYFFFLKLILGLKKVRYDYNIFSALIYHLACLCV